MDVVFQTAAAVWDMRTPARVYEEVNVGGNRLVVDVCRELGIRRLVYTSTIDVVVDGRRPIVDGDESLPYPRRLPRDPYSPHQDPGRADWCWRPMDRGWPPAPCARWACTVPGTAITWATSWLWPDKGNTIRLGSGKARFSHAYSENVAHAHLCAAAHLFPGSQVAGQAYFVGDHYPAGNFFDFMEPYLEALDLPVPRRSIPYPVAYGLACVAELVAPRSNFNRFAVIQTCVDHTYRHDQAERGLRLSPDRLAGRGLPAHAGRCDQPPGVELRKNKLRQMTAVRR